MAKTKKEKSIEHMLDEALVKENKWPYRNPNNWAWIKLGAINFRKPASLDPRKYPNDTFELYSVPSFKTDFPEVIKGKEIKSGKQLVQQGDILLCKINPRINRVWIVANHTDFDKIASSEWIVISPPETISKDYLMWLLQVNYFRNLLTSNVSGVGGSLTRARPVDVASYPIPVPPFEEQKRIVKKLSSMLAKLKEARELIQEAKDSFENRRAAILNKAFTCELTRKWRDENPDVESTEKGELQETPYNLPKSWSWVRLEALFHEVKKKVVPSLEINCAYIGLENLKTGGGLADIGKSNKVKSLKTVFRSGDVLYGKLRPYLNKHTKVDFDGITSTDILVFRPKGVLSEELLDMYLGMPRVVNYANRNSKGINLPRVSPKVMMRLLIPVPPPDEQKEIVRILDKLLNHEDEARTLIDMEEQIDLLEKSILSKAFRGEFGTNNPEDEPAIKLLERILEEKKSKPIILKPDDIKTSGSISKPKLLVKGPSGNTQVLLEEIKNKYGNKTFRANELKDISELSYDELKEALFELIKEPLDGKSKAKLKMNWAKGYLVQLSE